MEFKPRRWILGLGVLLLGAPLVMAQVAPSSPPAAPAKKRILWAALAGASAGAAAGSQGLSFSALPASERRDHQWRAGLTYGAMGGVLAAAWAARLGPSAQQEGAAAHPFWRDRLNLPLFIGIGLTQTLDYTSTRYFRSRGKEEWLLTNRLVDNRAAFTATEVGAVASGIALCYLLHRTGHHRLERWVGLAYIGAGAVSAVGNYRYPRTGHDLFGN